MRPLKRLAALSAVSGAALLVGPVAGASALDQTVTGVVAGTIALSVPTPAVFGSVFAPGATVSSTGGTVTALSTYPNWTLKAAETGGDGKLGRASATSPCDTTAAVLTNAASLTVAPAIVTAGITSAGAVALSGTDQTVASATAVPLAAAVFNTTYSQAFPANEVLTPGCAYTMTTTYTLASP